MLLRALVLLAGGIPALLRADMLVLANGDRITGTVIGHEAGQLLFQSPLLGEFRIAADQATIVTTSEAQQPSVSVTALETSAGRPAGTTTARTERRDPAWKRQIDLGISAQSGLRAQSNISLRLEASRQIQTGSVRLELSHQYGKSDGYVYSDATNGQAVLTRNLNEDLFVRGATRFDRDPVLGLDHDAEQSLGLGYTLLNGTTFDVSVGGGAALRNRATDSQSAEWDGLLDAFGRLSCSFSERLKLSQDVSVTAAPDNRNDYRFKSQTALVNQLTEMLHMTLRYEFEYVGAAPAGVPIRQRLVTAIGCVF